MPFAEDGDGIIELGRTDLREKPRPQHLGNEFFARGYDSHLLGLRRFVPGPAADIDPTTLRQSLLLETVSGQRLGRLDNGLSHQLRRLADYPEQGAGGAVGHPAPLLPVLEGAHVEPVA